MRYALRPATLGDVGQVAELMREVGFRTPSEAGWRWLYQDNPARNRRHPLPEIGWVLERDGAVHGFLGNVHLDYVLDGAPLRVATDTSYYVRPGARSESTRLMSAFFRQPGVDLFLSTTANEASGSIYRLFKAAVPEDPSFSEELVWVGDDRVALRNMLTRRKVPATVANGLAALAAPASRLARRLTGFATPPRGHGHDAVLTLHPGDLDARFDELWARVETAPGLRVRRDAATLRWYLSDPDAGGDPTIFAVTDEGGLVGYAVVARHRPAADTAAQMRILDLVVRPGGERVVPTLVRRVLARAREVGVGVGLVYCAPCGAALAGELKALRPHRLRHAHPLHFLRAAQHARTASLASPGIWQATGLDGDTPLCIENVPVSAARSPG